MSKDANAVLLALKPKRTKFPTSAPPYLSAHWKSFVAAVDTSLAELELAKEPAEVGKARGSYAAKKAELKNLKSQINNAVIKSRTHIDSARKAQAEAQKLANTIGQATKGHDNEAATKVLWSALSLYLNQANAEFGGLTPSASIDDNL